MRTKAVVKLIAPYTRMKLAWIARQLKIPATEVQDILGFLIVDDKIHGKIDQQSGTLEIESGGDIERVKAIETWATALSGMYSTIFDGDGLKLVESQGPNSDGLDTSGSNAKAPRHQGLATGDKKLAGRSLRHLQ
jgi:COP9 signalosome complex subunit 2